MSIRPLRAIVSPVVPIAEASTVSDSGHSILSYEPRDVEGFAMEINRNFDPVSEDFKATDAHSTNVAASIQDAEYAYVADAMAMDRTFSPMDDASVNDDSSIESWGMTVDGVDGIDCNPMESFLDVELDKVSFDWDDANMRYDRETDEYQNESVCYSNHYSNAASHSSMHRLAHNSHDNTSVLRTIIGRTTVVDLPASSSCSQFNDNISDFTIFSPKSCEL